MNKIKIKCPSTIAILLVFSIGILLSGNAFAAPPFATIGDLNAEIANRTKADTVLQNQIVINKLPPVPAGRFEATFTVCGNSDIPTWGPCFYAVGDTGPAGGIVFYVTDQGLRGLEAAPVDQSDNAEWGCAGTSIPGANDIEIGTGAVNTRDILRGCPTPGIAARIADDYVLNGYTDWFLPSKDELNLMYTVLHQHGLGSFVNDSYWSSSELDNNNYARFVYFGNGVPSSEIKYQLFSVRAVRAF